MFEIVKNPYNDKKIYVSVFCPNNTVKHYVTTWKKFYRAIPPENITKLSYNKEWFFKKFMNIYEWEYILKYYDFFYIMNLSITDKAGNIYNFRE